MKCASKLSLGEALKTVLINELLALINELMNDSLNLYACVFICDCVHVYVTVCGMF